MRLSALAGKRVAVWGYGREGKAALSVLRRKFPGQPVTLFCSAAEAAGIGRDGEGIEIVTTAPDAAALSVFDIVIKSPGIGPYREPYVSAEKAGVRFTSGTAIWFAENANSKAICVTGTKGKSTVTALIAHLLRAGGKRVALAGNIGLPLLELLEPYVEPDWWVIELSSFQTRDFGGAPTVAVVNNLLEEHLDWHGDADRYRADKLKILGDGSDGVAVLNAGDRATASIRTPRKIIWFNSNNGWHARDDSIFRGDEEILPLAQIPLPGLHNAHNVCAALAAIDAAGIDARTLAQHVATFKALPHRLQRLGVRDDIEYVNDSISTTPYAAIEALRSVGGKATAILVGGFDRGVDWQPFVDFVALHPPRAVITMGANGDAITAALAKVEQHGFELVSSHTLAEAFARARASMREGGVILLSPGAPSFDQFKDYAERGREFARLAGFDPAAIAQIEGMGIA
ncbi:UDP-N-acetylmuramoyl-L-alanine--D-glutamate ligase [Rudaea sp.]|uniref:UDP-N-acetylmuramoyl-L-alanine--D-glutamate ligase n=1 Tax=Rudaea sp. TaxID=2136325 RepID=UPI002ED3DBB7